MKTFIVLPTFNEAQNLGPIVEQILALTLDDPHLLIIDDNSQDGTGELAEQLCARHPTQMTVMHRPSKLGLGTAYLTGFEWALERGADCVVQMDSDFSHSPSYLPSFVAQMQKYDLVVGSRYVPGGKLDPRWSEGRRFLSMWANSIWVRSILGLKVRDATAGFKCWSRRALEQIPLRTIRANGYVFQVEMAYLSEMHGMHILEWPIYFEDRRIGESKMSMPVKVEAAWRVFEIRARYGGLKKTAQVEYHREPA